MPLRVRVSPLPTTMRPGKDMSVVVILILICLTLRIMEIIGKGNYETGAVWVARKVPDGYICAHANQARIQTFPLDDPENCLYSADVITFAKKIGLYPEDGADADFSFSDTYDPVTFSGARACDARVWSVFGAVMGEEWAAQYQDYALGYNLTNRMPLWVKPSAKLSAADTMQLMRSHYEGTALDMAGLEFSDVGAYTQNVYRAHPLGWSSKVNPDGSVGETANSYTHERPIATPQTGWNFVAQSRSWLPRELSGLLWFGVDDSSTTVHFPVYGSATRVSSNFYGQGPQDGVVPPMMTFNMESAFYAFNLVANWAYTRWDLIYPEIYSTIIAKESQYISEVADLDKAAVSIAQSRGIDAAIEYVTSYSERTGNALVKDWNTLFGQLFVKYRDGYIVTANADSKACGCTAASAGYPQDWYDRIVTDTGAHYAVVSSAESKPSYGAKKNPKLAPVDKMALLARR